ncbi:MAG: glycosyltransferase [Verrucomicrobiota bacterium]
MSREQVFFHSWAFLWDRGGVGQKKKQQRRYGIIIPVCDEEACLGQVIDELRQVLPKQDFVLVIGLNATSDESGEIAEDRAVIVGRTEMRGYGYGCMAAIDALQAAGEEVDAYIFCAGDGASRPQDVLCLVQRYEATGVAMVIGLRRFVLRTWWQQFGRALPNLILGGVGFVLTGRFYHDLGPLRLIGRHLFGKLDLQEMTWGWTIEAEVKASRLGQPVETIAVQERERVGGLQKVSGVSLIQSLKIGTFIMKAGVRARLVDY